MALLPRRLKSLVAVWTILVSGVFAVPAQAEVTPAALPAQVVALTSSAEASWAAAKAAKTAAKVANAKYAAAQKAVAKAKVAKANRKYIAKYIALQKAATTAQTAVTKALADQQTLLLSLGVLVPAPIDPAAKPGTPPAAPIVADPAPVLAEADQAKVTAAQAAIDTAQAKLKTSKASVTAYGKKYAAKLKVYLAAVKAQTAAKVAVATSLAASQLASAAYDDRIKQLNAATGGEAAPGNVCLPGQIFGAETVWECGTVKHISDGDTIVAATNNGDITIRTIGVQAPEVAHLPIPAQCGGDEAETALRKQIPVGSEVQLRSVAKMSYNARTSVYRYYRSIYARAADGTFSLDTADALFTKGLAIWFPLRTAPGSGGAFESVNNERYRKLMEQAIRAKRGIWSTTFCTDPSVSVIDNQREITPIIWADINPSGSDTVCNEKVLIKNPARVPLKLGNWKIRDTALEFFRFPANAVLAPGNVATVFVGKAADFAAGGACASVAKPHDTYFYGKSSPIFQNFDSTIWSGDGAMLLDAQGPSGSGGNTRAWFFNPCLTAGLQTTACATPPTDELVAVPDVTGRAIEDASALLTQSVLTVVTQSAASTPELVGKVITQTPAAGTQVRWGTQITLTVGEATPTP